MSLGSSRTLRPNPLPRHLKAALSVGRRVFVNCPGLSRGVMLMDDAGRSISRLADGAEVEIVAWRPRGGAGTRYRVLSTRDRLEGWLAAEELRISPQPAPTAAPSAALEAASHAEPPRPVRDDGARKFGQRR